LSSFTLKEGGQIVPTRLDFVTFYNEEERVGAENKKDLGKAVSVWIINPYGGVPGRQRQPCLIYH